MTVGKIYFDMDGVLADFNRGVRELCGMEAPSPDGVEDALLHDRMWKKIREVGKFYDKLELMPGAKEMFDAVYGKYGEDCEILTGIPRKERGIVTAEEDKRNWTRRLLSDKVKVNAVCRKEKQNYCTGEDCILIDDREKTIREWKAMGGTGILHVSPEQTLRELKELGYL